MLIITYDSEKGDWNKLVSDVRVTRNNPQKIPFAQILSSLQKRGTVQTRVVQTAVRSKKIDEIMHALSFVASNGNPEYKSEFFASKVFLEKELNSKYCSSEQYCFPFDHYFIVVEKL
jgi:hypothetical protein